jgi:integrase
MALVLSIYRRHRTKCKHADDRMSKQCRCPLWATGTLEGVPYRKSLKTRSFDRAEQLKREIENGNKPEQLKSIMIHDALDAFVTDCESRNLNRATLAKYRLLRRSLDEWCVAHLVYHLADFRVEEVRSFRTGWKLAPRTASKQLERLRAFFNFCIENDWLAKNPAKSIKAPQVEDAGVNPFSAKQQSKILTAAYHLAHAQEPPKAKTLPVHPKTGTFIKLLLNTGLRITDAALLHRTQIQNGRLILKAKKNKMMVSVPLPPDLLGELDRIDGDLFPSPQGSTRPETVSDYWRDQINKVFAYLGMNGHPHQFRHSLVMNMLNAGSSIEDCARVIGDSPRIVAQHYWQFCTDTQQRVDVQVAKTWKPALQIVKSTV